MVMMNVKAAENGGARKKSVNKKSWFSEEGIASALSIRRLDQ